jgi:voltage-gated potassium channel
MNDGGRPRTANRGLRETADSAVPFASATTTHYLSALWFAVNMVTTVGDPGFAPDTVAGRVIAIVVMIVGIGFVAFVTAFIADRFISTSQEVEAREDQVLAELRSSTIA